MKLIVGLGNVGDKYDKTRHNAGFILVDYLAERDDVVFTSEKKFEAYVAKEKTRLLIKPTTFMNNSGEAVSKLVNFYKVKMEDLFIVHDDLDIVLGGFKIQKGVGPKVHNGINSIEESLGKKDFWRVRIGVDNRSEDERAQLMGGDYVLNEFTGGELKILEKVIGEVIEKLG